ncbi:MAG: hypothetical protein E3J94_06505 [Desulfobacteraceae bacterium]|nr:MAG: hypothetical protein E3J94_06505 [Desulfobacteraceae bacterium]
MNSLLRKIVACLLIIMFGINFIYATAGAVDRCVSQACCCCDSMAVANYGLTIADDSVENGCCSSSENIPCNIDKDYAPDAQDCIISTVRENLLNADGLITFVIGEPFLLQFLKENVTTPRFLTTSDPIPIYLQNLTFIC